jgi:glycosyltransferase involved in cell wall biosynthesis
VKLTLITATHHRVAKLAKAALPSVLGQTEQNFEWIIVNDGRDRATQKLVAAIQAKFTITYLEMDHPTSGFGLCHARNLGIFQASGEIVAYLDDDNTLSPNFVLETLSFFQCNPLIKCSMVQQSRRRDVVRNGIVIKRGKSFIAPSAHTDTRALIRQSELFDSNGFVHYRHDAPQWNPKYRVFADYEYFLKCASLWGCSSFKLNPQILVNYVQTSDGVIGKSNYQCWATELQAIYDHREQYGVLKQLDVQFLSDLVKMYSSKHHQRMSLPVFSYN